MGYKESFLPCIIRGLPLKEVMHVLINVVLIQYSGMELTWNSGDVLLWPNV